MHNAGSTSSCELAVRSFVARVFALESSKTFTAVPTASYRPQIVPTEFRALGPREKPSSNAGVVKYPGSAEVMSDFTMLSAERC